VSVPRRPEVEHLEGHQAPEAETGEAERPVRLEVPQRRDVLGRDLGDGLGSPGVVDEGALDAADGGPDVEVLTHAAVTVGVAVDAVHEVQR
jgi:hypothetical protein